MSLQSLKNAGPEGIAETKDPGSSQPRLAGNNEFSFDLAHVLPGDGNLFFSPFNIRMALAMTYAGAREGTEKAMAKVLRFPEGEDQKVLHLKFSEFIERMPRTIEKSGGKLRIANGIWAQEGYPVEYLFRKVLSELYKAPMHLVNFAKDPEGARQEINAWVEETTERKIREVISPESVLNEIRMILVSAIYFNDFWDLPFMPSMTQNNVFLTPDRPAKKVPTMFGVHPFGYAESDAPGMPCKFLEMPYKSGLSFLAVLPEEYNPRRLTFDDLVNSIPRLGEEIVEVWLPKFKMTSSFSAREVLMGMGMECAFTEEADFTGISRTARIGSALKIYDVTHNANIEVDEKGTEAAAATTVWMGHQGCQGPVTPPVRKEFKANHPFLFMIREKATGTILFMGRVEDPSEG